MTQSKVSEKYDIIIAGVGAAGLMLAYRLATNHAFTSKRILLLDKEKKAKNDRTWCFWSTKKTPFDHIIHHSWPELEFASDSFQHKYNLSPYAYKMLKSADFYSFVWQTLSPLANFSFEKTSISSISEQGNEVEVVTANGTYYSELLFDSRLDQTWVKETIKGANLQLQHFKGVTISSAEKCFQPEKARLFDFRIPQQGEVRFMYVLPVSETQALVEFTVFSEKLLEETAYDDVLEKYIKDQLGIEKFSVLEQESGIIPMTDYVFERNPGKRIVNIGTRGGLCKPSSGYAFLRMWKDSENIVNQLVRNNAVVARSSKKRYQLFDALLLDIIKRDGGNIAEIFSFLFKNNPVDRIFRFLDEETTVIEDFQVMASVPSKPFFISIYNLLRSR